MKMLSTKKEERLERKKKKLSALATMMEINAAEKSDEPEAKKKKVEMTETPAKLSDEQYKDLKKELARKRSELKNVPVLRLKPIAKKASLEELKNDDRTPLLLDDIQNLLMVSLLKNHSPFTPWRWCHLEKVNKLTQSVVLLVDGINSYEFVSNESLLVKSRDIFETKLEVLLPESDEKKIVEHLACVPLTESYKERLIRAHGTLEAAMGANIDHKLVYKTVFPVHEAPDELKTADEEDTELPEGDKFSRVQLLLSPLQMIDEDYPIPLKGELATRCKNYIMTQDSYLPVTAKSPMFGLDCEMCKVVSGRHEVARVSVVNEQYESVYETLVRPELQIMDYLTPFSGITKEIMDGATKTLKEVQQDLRKILTPDAILVGQSLQFDLHGLNMMHPYIIDTSVIFNISGERQRKSKLQTLAKEFLGEEIQKAYTGHNSIEDSCASLKLAKLKLSHDIYFGDAFLQRKRELANYKSPSALKKETENVNQEPVQQVATTIFSHMAKKKKKSLIVTTANTEVNYEEYFKKAESNNPVQCLQVSTAKKAVSKASEMLIDHEFALTHVKMTENDESVASKMQKVDKFVSKLWKSVALNGLFVVILAGKSNSGVALIQIKNRENCSFNSAVDEEPVDGNTSD
ncbi:RNA exonuclease 5 [Culicoides brevitarsis]|uniref:RNA exonuclease 5 n=1 Tax=Culicoides brevitarsis TaxID=469753 RepID=UPI00307C8173